MSDVDAWVSAEFQTLAQVLYEYDHNLRLEMIPFSEHHKLIDKTKVFRIIDISRNAVVYTFSAVNRPDEILAHVFSSDLAKGDVIGEMDARNAALEALNNQKIIDEREARKDLAAFIIKNTKSRWTHEGRVRDDEFRDLGPVAKVIT